MWSLRCGAIGIAAEAVEPRTDRNHTADASLTVMPLLFKTLKQKKNINGDLFCVYFLGCHVLPHLFYNFNLTLHFPRYSWFASSTEITKPFPFKSPCAVARPPISYLTVGSVAITYCLSLCYLQKFPLLKRSNFFFAILVEPYESSTNGPRKLHHFNREIRVKFLTKEWLKGLLTFVFGWLERHTALGLGTPADFMAGSLSAPYVSSKS